MRRPFGFLIGAVAVLVGATVPLGAQNASSGTITGRVVQSGTDEPLADVQIFVVGTQLGTRTSDDGVYRIVNVPAGEAQVRTMRIGYKSATATIAVPAGGSATANFALETTPIELDQIVVTATGETQRRREQGNSSTTIAIDSVPLAAVTNFSDLLSSRASGVTVQSSGGSTGTGSRIRIRGSNSVSLSNDPLVIVDGVRLNTASTGTDVSSLDVGGAEPSRFNDINPEDIESIEIIKGPAGLALYGTAAANGVIQITTKRGRSGKPQWSAFAERGLITEPNEYPANYFRFGTDADGELVQCTTLGEADGQCVPTSDPIAVWNPLEQASPYQTGWRENYGMTVSGGSDVATYYIGGDYEREEGVIDYNRLHQLNLRTNIRAQLAPTFTATVTAGFLNSKVQLPQNDNNLIGIVGSGVNGYAFDCSPATPCGADTISRGYGAGQVPAAFSAIQTLQNVNRFTGGLSTTWQARDWLSFNSQLGADIIARVDEETVFPGQVFYDEDYELGYRQDNRFTIGSYTANLGGTATFAVTPDLVSTSQAGVQYASDASSGNYALGYVLLPGTGSLEGTSDRFAVGNRNRANVTLGAYVQQQLGWRDRLFLTAGVRGDDNSAFGTDFGFVLYPAVQGSWVISEENFFPVTPWVNTLRLRAAYGQSGQRPNFRDASTYYLPVAARIAGQEVSAVTIGGSGNAELKPERSAEFETGFEASLLNDRVGLDVSYFNKTTSDALIARRLAGSLGASLTRFENLGEVNNRGLEAQLTADVLQMDNVQLSASLNASWLKNELVELGSGVGDIVLGFGQQRHREGYPLGGFWDTPYTFADANADGLISSDEVTYGDLTYLGPSLPTREMSLNTSLTLFGFAKLSSLFDYRGGYKQFNSTEEFRCDTYLNCRAMNDPSASLADQAAAVAAFNEFVYTGFIEDASFVKLREVALTFSAPQRWNERLGVSGLSLTLAGRNLATWTDYRGLDPEINNFGQSNFSQAEFNTQPSVRYWTSRINFNF